MVDFITNFFRNTKTYRRLALHFFTLLWVSVLLTFIPFIKALFINVKHLPPIIWISYNQALIFHIFIFLLFLLGTLFLLYIISTISPYTKYANSLKYLSELLSSIFNISFYFFSCFIIPPHSHTELSR